LQMGNAGAGVAHLNPPSAKRLNQPWPNRPLGVDRESNAILDVDDVVLDVSDRREVLASCYVDSCHLRSLLPRIYYIYCS